MKIESLILVCPQFIHFTSLLKSFHFFGGILQDFLFVCSF